MKIITSFSVVIVLFQFSSFFVFAVKNEEKEGCEELRKEIENQKREVNNTESLIESYKNTKLDNVTIELVAILSNYLIVLNDCLRQNLEEFKENCEEPIVVREVNNRKSLIKPIPKYPSRLVSN